MNRQTKNIVSGFTIVELLIVVIIIGVLASIVIITYASAQMQARNAQTISAVTSYKKSLAAYVAENGEYPKIAENTWGSACLGENYPTISGYEPNKCWHLDQNITEHTYFNDLLRTHFGGDEIPLPSVNPIVWNRGNMHMGATFLYLADDNATLDGEPHNWYLGYTLEGHQSKCSVGPLLAYDGGYPNFTTSNSENYTQTYEGNGIECIIALPTP